MQYLRVSSVSHRSHLDQDILSVIVCCCGLRMQNKWYSEETFDPFDELVSTMCLERVLDSIACCHLGLGSSLGSIRGNYKGSCRRNGEMEKWMRAMSYECLSSSAQKLLIGPRTSTLLQMANRGLVAPVRLGASETEFTMCAR